jgi:hypothetical protein
LLGRGLAAESALVAVRVFAGAGVLPDEGRAVRGARLDVDALLDTLSVPSSVTLTTVQRGAGTGLASAAGEDLEALWTEDIAELGKRLGHALDGGGDARRRALLALDTREGGGVGLGVLTGPGTVPPSASAAAALRALGERLRDKVAAALDDADPETRLVALRVATRLLDPRVTVWHLQAVLARPTPGAESAVRLAATAQIQAGRIDRPALVQALRPGLSDGAWERRLAVVHLLELALPAARAELSRALSDPSPFVRAAAANALAGDAGATRALLATTRDQVAAVRAEVARALHARPGPAVAAALSELARDEAAPVRAAAASP